MADHAPTSCCRNGNGPPCPPTDGDWRSFFRDHGLRCTRQRGLIYSSLRETDQHPTADELYLAIRASEPGLSLATVYNTLEALTSAGLCRRIPSSSGSGACRYDADVSPHAHVLLDDGRVVDVPAELGKEMLEGIPGELLERIEARLGVKLEDVSVTLHAAGSDDASDAD